MRIRPEITGMARMQSSLDAERDLVNAVGWATVGFIVLSVIVLIGFLWFMEKSRRRK